VTFTDACAQSSAIPNLEALGATVFRGADGGLFAVVPSEVFDQDSLPTVDLEPLSVEGVSEDVDRRLAIPFYRPRCLRGGVHIVAREHVAAAWHDMTPEALEWEYEHRRAEDKPIPRFLEDAVTEGVVQDGGCSD